MGDTIKIKKYANRRLYDTDASHYITLSDIPAMIEGGKNISVIDAKSGEDITRSVLIQLVVEQESSESTALFPVEFWAQALRLYSSSMGNLFVNHINNIMSAFLDHQAVIEAQTKEMFNGLSVNPFVELAEKNISIWRNMLEGMSGSGTGQPAAKIEEVASHAEELKAIKEQIAALSKQLTNLQSD